MHSLTMKIGLFYDIFKTPAGWIGILASSQGCLRTTLPQHSSELALTELGKDAISAIRSPAYLNNLRREFEAYFNGEEVAFLGALDLSGATPFERAVWEATRLIPRGETRSYAWVANQISNPRAPRAVGQALARNPLPIIIPCHRVLTTNGKLGGFGGGLKMKEFLLALEAGHSSRS